MNRKLVTFVALSAIAVIIGCQPKKNGTVTFTCSSCDTAVVQHLPDTNSIRYYLPTAFTPNGDGMNDVFWLFYTGLDPDSCRMVIYDAGGRVVFDDKITQTWTGRDKNGAVCGAGKYPVSLLLNYLSGGVRVKTTICACVTLLHYSGSCINTGGITYHFPDQIHPDSGFVYPTNDVLCP